MINLKNDILTKKKTCKKFETLAFDNCVLWFHYYNGDLIQNHYRLVRTAHSDIHHSVTQIMSSLLLWVYEIFAQ